MSADDERSSSGRRPSREHYPWYVGPASLLVQLIERAIFSTTRLTAIEGEHYLDSLRSADQAALFVFWHNRAVFCGYFLYQQWLRHGHSLGMLTSSSRDGEIAARAAKSFGFEVARGSVGGGGLTGLKQMHRMLSRKNTSVLSVGDGSRGPIYKAQPSMIVLAQTARVPLVPISYSAGSRWRLGSWDRMIVPKPFSRLAVAVGKPIEYPNRLDKDELEVARQQLEDELNQLSAKSEKLLGL